MNKVIRLSQLQIDGHESLLVLRRLSRSLCRLANFDAQRQSTLLAELTHLAKLTLENGGSGEAKFEIEAADGGNFLLISIYESNLREPLVDIKEWTDESTKVWSDALDNVRNSSASVSDAACEELLDSDAQLIQLSQELQQTRAELEKVDKLRSQFLANVSHEIRTPMNAIVGLINMMERGTLSPEQKKRLGLIKDSSTSLLTIINDILDLSKIEAGKFELNNRAFDLKELLSNTVQILHHQADLKNLTVSLQYRVPPEYVISDPVRIRQILVNLIGNALKFSHQGEISIKVDNLGRQGKIRKVRFDVIDQGIGIEPDFVSELFRPFVQVDGANTRRFGGTGLGLSICRKLVEMLDGEIGVESKLGEGSNFWFIIPLELAEEKLEETAPMKAIRMDNWKPLLDREILLAEDHPINQMVAISELEDCGAKVDVVENGQAAIEACRKKNYDLLLMDCQMPVMDGYEAAKILRSEGFKLPIVAMTASAMSGDRERCLLAGMTDYISKPFEENELKQVVTRWVSGESRKLVVEPIKVSSSPENPIDLNAIKKRYGEGGDKLVKAYYDDLKLRLTQMPKLVEENKFQELAREAHSLSGASGLVFSPQLRDAFRTLEADAKSQDTDSTMNSLSGVNKLFQALTEQLGVK